MQVPIRAFSILVACLTCASHSYDRSTSRLWTGLVGGQSQSVVIWGTSLSHAQYSYWPALLGPAIDSACASGRVTVHQLAMTLGNSSGAVRRNMDTLVSLRPDAVVMEFAANDAVNRLDCTIDACAGPNLRAMVDTLRSCLPLCDVFLYVTAPPWDTVSCAPVECRYCTSVFAQRCRRSARVSNDDTVEQYYDNVRAIADSLNTHLVDTYEAFRTIHDTAFESYRNYLYDGVHPSSLAARQIIVPHMLDAMRGNGQSVVGRSFRHGALSATAYRLRVVFGAYAADGGVDVQGRALRRGLSVRGVLVEPPAQRP